MIAFIVLVILVGVLVVCATLVTRWALKSAETYIRERTKEQEAPEEVDPATLSVSHLDGWDEIIFEGRRYRKCLRYSHPTYNRSSVGWLHYPEGTVPNDWLSVNREYVRRLDSDESSLVARRARQEWTGEKETPTPAPTPAPTGVVARAERQQREEELDRRVEEARAATHKSRAS